MIRPANLIDIPRMVELGRMMQSESPEFAGKGWNGDKVAKLIAALIDHRQGFVMVAERNGVVIGGFIGAVEAFFFSDVRTAFDLALYVEPGKRGGVVAARLLKAFTAWALAQDVAPENIRVGITTGVAVESSTKLYQACGFAPTGHLFQYQGDRPCVPA